jgi:hypothetical protein
MRMTGRMVAALIAAMGGFLGLAVGVTPAAAGAPELAIAVDAVHRPEPQDGQQSELAAILEKLLPSRLERAFGEQLKSYAWVERVHLPDDQRAIRESLGGKFHYLMIPTVEPGTRAYPVRVDLYDFGVPEDDRSKLPPAVNEIVVISPGADFREIEVKIDELAVRLARRIAAGRTTPVGAQGSGRIRESVLVWCVVPYSPEDSRATLLSRQLTLQLPYFLARHMEASGYEVVGISPHEFYSECTLAQTKQRSDRASRGFERYNYIASGQIFPNRGGSYELNLLLDGRDTTYAVPLPAIQVAEELDEAAFADISDKFATALERFKSRK